MNASTVATRDHSNATRGVAMPCAAPTNPRNTLGAAIKDNQNYIWQFTGTPEGAPHS